MSTDRAALLRLRAEVARDRATTRALLDDLAHRRTDIVRADPIVLGYAAITLHRAYTALESAFERICRTLEGSLPAGRDGHQALLADMALDLPGLRPAVLRPETAASLAVLLRFRHFVRHAYAVSWDPDRIVEVLDAAESLWAQLDADLATFLAFLDGVAG